ncbi:MAG: Hpt domain-containing protein [Nitrosomonadales bacterium]|nr:Hpt domain-containing protein [Nitrosomonadales bacterium]
MTHSAQFNLGTLAAVKPDVDGMLSEIGAQMDVYFGAPVQNAAAMEGVRAGLQRLLEVLKKVGLEGAAVFCAELELTLSELADNPQQVSAMHRDVLRRALFGIKHYLDSQSIGVGSAALGLFPQYQELQQLRGLEMSFELDLFYPSLDVPLPIQVLNLPVQRDATASLKMLRSQFQQGLLKWLRQDDAAASIKLMRQALEGVLRCTPQDGSRAFWWISGGLLDCLGPDGFPAEMNVRKLLSRIDQQMRALIDGNAGDAKPVLNEMLYLIGHCQVASEQVDTIKRVYALQQYFPELSAVSSSEVDERLGVLRDQLRVAEECWERCIQGDSAACENFTQHAEQMALQSDSLDRDVLQYLTKQIHMLSQYASSPELAQPIAIDMAMALLLLGSGIEFYSRIDSSFQKQAHILSERIQAAIKQHPEDKKQLMELVELHYQMEQGSDVMGPLAGEMVVNLQQVEQGLNTFFENPATRNELPKLMCLLGQIRGGLRISSLQHADQLLVAIQNHVHLFTQRNDLASQAERSALAEAIGALENYLQRLAHGHTSDVSRLQEASAGMDKLDHGAEAEAAASVGVAEIAAPLSSVSTPEKIAVPMDQALQGAEKLQSAGAKPGSTRRGSAEDQELLDIFIEEAQEVLDTIRSNLESSLAHPENHEQIVAIRRGFHTLKGSGRMVGLIDLGEVAWCIERAMNKWLQDNKTATPELLSLIKAAVQSFDGWVKTLKAQGEAIVEAAELKAAALQIENARHPETRPAAGKEAQPQVTSVQVGPAAAAMPDLAELSVAAAYEPAHEVLPLAQASDSADLTGEASLPSPALFNIARDEIKQNIVILRQMLDELRSVSPPVVRYDFMRAAHTLAGVSRTMEFSAVEALSHALEGWLQARMEQPFTLSAGQLQMLEQVIVELDGMMQSISDNEVPLMRGDLLNQLLGDKDNLGGTIPEPVSEPEKAAQPDILVPQAPETGSGAVQTSRDSYEQMMSDMGKMSDAVIESAGKSVTLQPMEVTLAKSVATSVETDKPVVHDELDEQLLPVFIEEAEDLIPKIDESLRAWRESPGDEQQVQALKRLLHTLKGSARMVGAMQIGEITHEMEDRVAAVQRRGEAGYWDELEDDFDHVSALVEEIRSGKPVENKRSLTGRRVTDQAAANGRRADRRALELGAERAALGNMLRVRSEAVDRLVGEASEISVARSRMETELQVVREGLQELTGSVTRLRRQLREVEIQAESQIQARVSLAKDNAEQFDPLELDRFTRFQELTRFMNESVHDVQTVQQSTLKNLEEAFAVMAAQGRLNRELQQGLMNIRMVSFNSITDRLYRVVRQTGKELNKRANLELAGTGVELDRSVLEKMIAPLEHLLRNAIVHGLEDEQVRAAKGKLPIGEIRLSVRQENNEVVFEFSDDGAGLNFEKLRGKAIASGLLQAAEQASDEQLAQLIFIPGLSTASEITEIAGRGIGMDVVRSEISALGGRIDVSSTRGEGTKFLIHLPLTLAFTQVLMVRAGEAIYAIPSLMVEQVRQAKQAELEELLRVRQVEWQGHTYPLHYLPHLLGNPEAVQKIQPRNSVLLLRSGGQRIALHTDELLGNQGVMVKNIGPQLARLSGIAGATVLGDGKVVLILNPEQLVHYAGSISKAKKAIQDKPFNTAPLIMVVDDSLTVRKITSRMLSRAGYQVVTATDGVDALEKLGEFTPDVMLLDIEMPRMDGFALAKELRRNPKTLDLPIIMITSRTADKHRDYAMQLGVNTYLGKPYQEDVLLQKIADFVAVHKLDTAQ